MNTYVVGGNLRKLHGFVLLVRSFDVLCSVYLCSDLHSTEYRILFLLSIQNKYLLVLELNFNLKLLDKNLNIRKILQEKSNILNLFLMFF